MINRIVIVPILQFSTELVSVSMALSLKRIFSTGNLRLNLMYVTYDFTERFWFFSNENRANAVSMHYLDVIYIFEMIMDRINEALDAMAHDAPRYIQSCQFREEVEGAMLHPSLSSDNVSFATVIREQFDSKSKDGKWIQFEAHTIVQPPIKSDVIGDDVDFMQIDLSHTCNVTHAGFAFNEGDVPALENLIKCIKAVFNHQSSPAPASGHSTRDLK